MVAVESDAVNMAATPGSGHCQDEEDIIGGTAVLEMERIEQRNEEDIETNVSEKISHDVLIHNIDTTLTGASAFVNQPWIL